MEDFAPKLPDLAPSFFAPPEEQEPVSNATAVWDGFKLENSVVNAWEYLATPGWTPQEGYDNVARLKKDNLWEFRDRFIGAQSDVEFDYRKAKLLEETTRRKNAMEGGWPGWFGMMAGGLVDPTILIPLVGEGVKGAQAFRSAAMLAGMGAALQEIPLQLNQTERTAEESVISVLAQAVIGGTLGTLAAGLRNRELERMASDMVNSPGYKAIPRLGSEVDLRGRFGDEPALPPNHTRLYQKEGGREFSTNPREAELMKGEKERYVDLPNDHSVVKLAEVSKRVEVPDDVIKLAKDLPEPRAAGAVPAGAQIEFEANQGLVSNALTKYSGVGKANEFINPLARVIEQPGVPEDLKFQTLRWFTQQLSSGGMKFKDAAEGKAVAPQGYVHELAQLHNASTVKAIQGYDAAFLKYVYEDEPASFIGSTSMMANRAAKKQRKLTKPEFLQAVGKAAREDVAHPVKAVNEAAKAWRQLSEDMYKQAVDVGIYDEVKELIGDPRYLTRVFDANLVAAHRPRLIRDLTDYYVGELEAEFAKAAEKFKRAEAKQKQLLEDIALPKDEAEKFRQEFLDKIKASDIARSEEQLKLEDDLQIVKERLFDLHEQKKTFVDNRSIEERQKEMKSPLDKEIEALIMRKKEVELLLPEQPAEYKAMRKDLRNRLNSLNKSLKLRELVPEAATQEIGRIKSKFVTRRDAFNERWRIKGLDDVGEALNGASPGFRDFAEQLATDVTHAMDNTTLRTPAHDMIVGAHGPEKARMLGIASSKIDYVLENDIEKITRIYMRTMGPDIELARRFGDFNASRWLGKGGIVETEFNDVIARIDQRVDKKGQPLSKEAKAKLQLEIRDKYQDFMRTTRAQIDRIRHLNAIPENPDAISYRIGRTVMNLNVLRLMGMVTISSVADPKNMILRNGLTRTMRDVFIPMITNFKEFKASAREADLAAATTDIILHTRTHSIYDTPGELEGGTKVERGVNILTSKMGLIAGFDLWNRELKRISAVGSMAHMMDAMASVMEGKGSAKEIEKATKFLANAGLGPDQINKIWKEVVSQTGGERVNGLWWPNTEHWQNKDAVRMFRAAMLGEVNSTIITPGLERPIMSDANIGMRMAFQFKSFGFASLSRSLMAGLQEPDMALVNSTMISLALGAFSYYLWALSIGGDALDEAMQFDPNKWADEAIHRSGLLAIGDDVQQIAQRIPGLSDYASFSGGRTSNRQGVDLVGLFLGPSFDFATKAGTVLQGASDPTRATFHALRQLLPFQNLWALRQALDKMEAASGLPERRQ